RGGRPQRARRPGGARPAANDIDRARAHDLREPAAGRRRPGACFGQAGVPAVKRMPFFDNPVLRTQLPTWRARLVLILLSAGFLALVGRALFLQGLSTEFLQQQGERRYERTLTLPATRGKILDRNGVVLASSVPARAVWAI